MHDTPKRPRRPVVPGRKGDVVWLPRADVAISQVRGYAKLYDLVPVPADTVMFEVSSDGHQPVGIVAKYLRWEDGVKAVNKLDGDRLFHLQQLVTQRQIAKKLNRTPPTVTKWSKEKTWPDTVLEFGNVKLYFWPDVQKWYRDMGLGKFKPKPKRRI